MIDALPSEIDTIIKTVHQYAPGISMWVFGSRLKGNAKPSSDLDVVLVGPQKLPLQTLFLIKTDLAESCIPYRVDLMDWHGLSPEFKKIIQDQHEVIA